MVHECRRKAEQRWDVEDVGGILGLEQRCADLDPAARRMPCHC